MLVVTKVTSILNTILCNHFEIGVDPIILSFVCSLYTIIIFMY